MVTVSIIYYHYRHHHYFFTIIIIIIIIIIIVIFIIIKKKLTEILPKEDLFLYLCNELTVINQYCKYIKYD